jgi:hypothetical protein
VPGEREPLVEVTDAGVVQPVSDLALIRMQSRVGVYHVLAGPPHLVMLRRVREAGLPERACLLAGEIKSAGMLCDLAGFIAQTGWRGELVVEAADASRSIYFDAGSVVGSRSTSTSERLGEVLYRYGVLARDQVAACGDLSMEQGIRFGEAAVKLGLLSREHLFGAMSRQTEEIFFGTLLVGGGQFFFLEGFDDADLSARQKLSVATLVREGIRRMHETRYFRARIPSEAHIPVRVPGMAAPAVDPLDVFAATDGLRSVADIARAVGAGEFDVTRALFQLVQAGLIAITPPRLPRAAILRIYNEAIALILRELDALDLGDAVRDDLAKFAHTKGYDALFAGAGPTDDGTLDAERVVANVDALGQGQGDRLGAFLYEYASYALFLARPHLQRLEQTRGTGPRISARVTAILEPIAPRGVRPKP